MAIHTRGLLGGVLDPRNIYNDPQQAYQATLVQQRAIQQAHQDQALANVKSEADPDIRVLLL